MGTPVYAYSRATLVRHARVFREGLAGVRDPHLAFVILDREGQPLTDLDGKLIVLGSKAEAREFLMPGDSGVVSWDWWLAQNGEEAP